MPTQRTQTPSIPRNPKPAAPAYRQRAGYTQAIVTLTDAETRQRRDYWLGEFDQPESRERYHRVIAEWERRGRRLPPPDFDAPPTRRADEITIVEVIREYWRWAVDYYRPKHAQALDGALTILRQFYGRTAAIDFGPKKLRLLRDHMIRGDGSRRMPWSRKYINSQVQRIRHMFKWAAGHELVPVAVHQSLCTLEPLRRGRCDAREGKTDTYDRYSPRLQKLASALMQEWCDEVLFATYKVHTKTTNEGFDRKRVQGIGTGERIIRTTERPAHVAKNRLGLPEEFPLDYRIYAAFCRGENPLIETPEPAEQGA